MVLSVVYVVKLFDIILFIIFVLLIHQFLVSIKCSQLENKIDELVQEIAIGKTISRLEDEEQ